MRRHEPAGTAFPASRAINTLASVIAAGLATTGLVNTTANKGGATASVANVNVLLSGISTLSATTVSSQCTVNQKTGAISGSSSILNGSVSVLGSNPITLATAPAPNSTVSVPGIATITLNRQRTAADGTLTVDAIFVSLLGSTQTITIASSMCGPPALGIPVIAPAFAVGTVGAAAVGLPVLGFFLYRRRQTSADIARA